LSLPSKCPVTLTRTLTQGRIVVVDISWHANVQLLYRDGYELPAGLGFGYELDEEKIRSRIEL
jgi:hypothetical protein